MSSAETLKQPVLVKRVRVNLAGLNRDRAEIVVSGAQSLFLPNMAGKKIKNGFILSQILNYRKLSFAVSFDK